MTHYLIRAKLSAETWKALIANPEDRWNPVKQLCDRHGYKLHSYFFALGEHDVVAIIEADDDKMIMAFNAAVASSGSVTSTQATALVTTSEVVEAKRKTGEVAGTYQPPAAG